MQGTHLGCVCGKLGDANPFRTPYCITFCQCSWRSILILSCVSYSGITRYFFPIHTITVLRCVVMAWSNVRTANLITLLQNRLTTGPHPAKGDSGDGMYVRVCLVLSVFPTAVSAPHLLPVCRQFHTDSRAELDSIWTLSSASIYSPNLGSSSDRQISSPVLF